MTWPTAPTSTAMVSGDECVLFGAPTSLVRHERLWGTEEGGTETSVVFATSI